MLLVKPYKQPSKHLAKTWKTTWKTKQTNQVDNPKLEQLVDGFAKQLQSMMADQGLQAHAKAFTEWIRTTMADAGGPRRTPGGPKKGELKIPLV